MMHAAAIATYIHVMQQHQKQKDMICKKKAKLKQIIVVFFFFFFWCDAIKRNNTMQPQLLQLSCKSNANQKRIATQPQLLLQWLVPKTTMHDLQKKGKIKQIIIVCFVHFFFFF